MRRAVEIIKNQPDLVYLPSASEDEIFEAEEELGLHFAAEYIDCLKTYNLAMWDGVELTGICKSDRLNVCKATEKMRKQISGLPMNIYVVRFLNIDNIVIWQDENGIIYQTAEYQLPVRIANSLAEYLEEITQP